MPMGARGKGRLLVLAQVTEPGAQQQDRDHVVSGNLPSSQMEVIHGETFWNWGDGARAGGWSQGRGMG